MSVRNVDSRSFLAGLAEHDRPDIVYLDPMYPDPHRKAALPKKGIQYLRLIVGTDTSHDVATLLATAMRVARQRVVLKRPSYASHDVIAPDGRQLRPAHSYVGKSHRFDAFPPFLTEQI
jgi:16S rRNA (guanine1516-N2)-methyltransferase